MKKLFFLNLLFLFSILSAQIKYEKGYFITNDGEKHEVLIKNEDWLNNPTEFKYKNSETDSEKTGKISDVKEFQVYGYDKLMRYNGKIDLSSDNVQYLSTSKEPEWKEMEVYLYERSSGKISLYSYYFDNTIKFFYSENQNDIKPLVYKQYNPNGDVHLLGYNEEYKNQLLHLFPGQPKMQNTISDLEYSQKSLIAFFDKINRTETETLTTKKSNSKFNLYLKPGVSFLKTNIYAPYISDTYDVQFNSVNIKPNIEFEYVFPFNKNKWSIFAGASYNTIKGNTTSKDGVNRAIIKYNFLDFPIGIRHYLFLNNYSKISIDLSFPLISTVTKKGTLDYYSTYHDLNLVLEKCSSNFSFGIGYTYKNKLQIEFNHTLKRSMSNYVSWGSALTENNFTIGYNIF